MKTCLEIERSILKSFRKSLWAPFVRAIQTYDLIQDGDKIAVCISGGKDSIVLAKLFQEIKRHGKMNFELEFLVMDPGYNEVNRQKIIDNCEHLNIPIKIFNENIFGYVSTIKDSPCYLCARMRRGTLYRLARDLGCNKIALGHHFDDVIETILMGMLYGAQMQTMMPKLHSDNFEGMELIRPMYLIKEADVIRWCKYNELEFIRCACKFTEDDETEHHSKRAEIKQLIQHFRTVNPYIEYNIFRSVENVNLDTLISYHDETTRVHFLDHYNDKKEKKKADEDSSNTDE